MYAFFALFSVKKKTKQTFSPCYKGHYKCWQSSKAYNALADVLNKLGKLNTAKTKELKEAQASDATN